MHAATANPLWALASCRGLSTAEDVNNRARDKKREEAEGYNDSGREEKSEGAEEERKQGKEWALEIRTDTKHVDERTSETEKGEEKWSRSNGYGDACMHYAPLL